MARAPRAPKKPAGDPPPAATERLKSTKRTPELEIVLGARIRTARLNVGMSQTALGAAIGISFQQVQKYELGQDRVAASTMQGIAVALGVHPGTFFDEDPPSLVSSPGSTPRSTLASRRNAQRIGERIERLGDPVLIRRLMALIEAIENVKAGAVNDVEHASDDDGP